MEYKGFTLDPFQEESINAINSNKSVVVSAPTGSGKTLIADYIIEKDLQRGIKVIYTAPIKALSNQKYKEFTELFGVDQIGLLTGDIVKNPGAPILIMTTEVYRNMALVNDPMLSEVSYVIFDEIHFINDIERGYVWEESIIFSRDEVRFLCLSATIPNAQEFANWIQAIKHHNVQVVKQTKRNVPLEKKFFDVDLGICDLEEIKDLVDIPSHKYLRGKRRQRRPKITPPNHIELVKTLGPEKLPCFFFDFSRKNCQNNSLELARKKIFPVNPKIQSYIRNKLKNTPTEINTLKSTQILKKTLPFGIAFHHAGLLPIMKELVEGLFAEGLIKVLYTTETFAVGINMPAKTVCFKGLRKFDGVSFRFLNSKEYFQIAGRAGRRGIDKIGYSYAMIDRRDFDYNMLKHLTTKDSDPIKSQFRLSVNTVINILKRHSDKEINTILTMNFHTYQKYGKNFATASKTKIFSRFNSIVANLKKLEYLEGDELTYKGHFASRIYADEILTSEIFATDFYKELNEYQILLILCGLAYEPKEKDKFMNMVKSKNHKTLLKKIKSTPVMRKEKRFNHLDELTAMVDPIYHGKNIFDIIPNTNLLEGDVIRLLRQILDRIGQIREATHELELKRVLESVQGIVLDALKDIDAI